MRTKALLLTAVLGAAGIANSLAQVYSVNAVGYINLDLGAGFHMIANQLDDKAGNSVKNILKDVPDGTFLYKYVGGAFTTLSKDFGEWDADIALAPGEGAFLKLPNAYKITLVGEVPQNADSNLAIAGGLSIISSKVPQAMDLSAAAFAFPAADGDFVYKWLPQLGTYATYSYDFGAWDTSPSIGVGEAFWVKKVAAATWTRNFNVNQ
jgi:hypothetical protein